MARFRGTSGRKSSRPRAKTLSVCRGFVSISNSLEFYYVYLIQRGKIELEFSFYADGKVLCKNSIKLSHFFFFFFFISCLGVLFDEYSG